MQALGNRTPRNCHWFQAPRGLAALLGQHQTPPLGLRHRVAKFPGGVDPELCSLLGVLKRGFLSLAVGHTTRQFRHLGDKDLVLVAPVDNDLLWMIHSSPTNLYFTITARTWRTWYGFALLASRWRLTLSSTPADGSDTSTSSFIPVDRGGAPAPRQRASRRRRRREQPPWQPPGPSPTRRSPGTESRPPRTSWG